LTESVNWMWIPYYRGVSSSSGKGALGNKIGNGDDKSTGEDICIDSIKGVDRGSAVGAGVCFVRRSLETLGGDLGASEGPLISSGVAIGLC